MNKKKQQIYYELKEMIISGEFKPGDIIEEKEIIKTFGVSRTPVKDALNILEAQGWINFLSRKGIEIPHISIEEIKNIFQVRYEIEPILLKRGFSLLDRTKLRVLKERIEIGITEKNTKALSELDYDFHNLIFNTSDNEFFLELLTNVYERTQRIRNLTYLEVEDTISSAEDHIKIIDSIITKNLDGAKVFLKEHIEKNQLQLTKKFL